MTTRKRTTPELRDRIIVLCELLWSGCGARMARALKIDQATISRVCSKKQSPSTKLVEGLATWPNVNVTWLFTGRGEPLITAADRIVRQRKRSRDMSDEVIVQRAEQMYNCPRAEVPGPGISVQVDPAISRGSLAGAWVAAWVWVPNEPSFTRALLTEEERQLAAFAVATLLKRVRVHTVSMSLAHVIEETGLPIDSPHPLHRASVASMQELIKNLGGWPLKENTDGEGKTGTG